MKTKPSVSKSSRRHMVAALLLISDDRSGNYESFLRRQTPEAITALFEANKSEIAKVRDIIARRERKEQQQQREAAEAREKEQLWNDRWRAPKPITIREQPATAEQLVGRVRMMIDKCDARISEFTVLFKETGDPVHAAAVNEAREWKKKLEGMEIETVV